MTPHQLELHRMAQRITAIRSLARMLDEDRQGDPDTIGRLRSEAAELNRMIRDAIEKAHDATTD